MAVPRGARTVLAVSTSDVFVFMFLFPLSDAVRQRTETTVPTDTNDAADDQIDIGEVEGAERWHIADSLERASRKK